MTTHVLVHGNCHDGYGARYAYDLAVRDGRAEKAKHRSVAYGTPLKPEEFEPEDHVYILDFSYDRATLDALAARVAHLEVVDHHASAERELAGAPYALFDMNESGATLTWKRFFHNEPVPFLLRYIRARDLWRFDDMPDTEAVVSWIRSHRLTMEEWDVMAGLLETETGRAAAVTAGSSVLEADRLKVDKMSRHHGWASVGGVLVPCANATILYSDVGQRLCGVHPEAPFSAYYGVRSDGKWQWGLRGRGRVDLSVLAKTLGGGGHPDAAGFVEPAADALARLAYPTKEQLKELGCGGPCPKIMEVLA